MREPVAGLTLVTASGETLALTRTSPDFAGAVVGLGALGIVTSVTLDIEPAFTVAVSVHEGLAWDTLLNHFDAITGAAYSVSLFTNWARDTIDQVWLKQRCSDALPAAGQSFHGAVPARVRRHPLLGVSPAMSSVVDVQGFRRGGESTLGGPAPTSAVERGGP